MTASRNRRNEDAPAYDSSPLWIAAHCSADIAPVPESVSRSISTSSASSRKRLYPAASSFSVRSRRVDILIGWTEWILNGSMIVRYSGSSVTASLPLAHMGPLPLEHGDELLHVAASGDRIQDAGAERVEERLSFRR